jgi:T-complex protein 1 subunit epsilon
MSLVFDEKGRPFIVLKEQEKKERLKGNDAIKANINASINVGKILRTSLGPKSMDKMIQDADGDVTISNDGATILDKIEVKNHIGKLLVELSKSQDYEIGDGTTGVTVLASSLLEMSEPLIDKGIHPLQIAEGYNLGCQKAIENLNCISSKFEFRKTDTDTLVKTCMTTLSSKIVGRCKRQIAELCVRAVVAVADVDRKEVNIELIKIYGKTGGKLEDSILVKGVVIDKEMSHPLMRKHINNAQIAIMTCPFEPPKPKTKHKVEIETSAKFEDLRKMEQDYFINMIQQCRLSGANLVICQWGFDDEANHLLMQYDLPAVRWVGGVEIELIAIATGSRIVPRFQEISPNKLGSAKIVREVTFGTTKEKVIFIEGCHQSSTVTLFVRGGSKMVVDESKRSLHDAICVARNLIRANGIIYGGGSAELSCSIAISEAAKNTFKIEHYALLAFADAIDQIPFALAENAGLNPIEVVTTLKARQIREKNPFLGVDCFEVGTDDMREQQVFETLDGKKQQLLLATESCNAILKIDDIILYKESL